MGGAGEEVNVTGTEGGTVIIIIEVEAAVWVQINTRIVAEADMTMKGVVKAGLMEVPPLLRGVSLLKGAHHHVEHLLLGALVLMIARLMGIRLLPEVCPHGGVNLLILEDDDWWIMTAAEEIVGLVFLM